MTLPSRGGRIFPLAFFNELSMTRSQIHRSTLCIQAAAVKKAGLIEGFVQGWAQPTDACLDLVLADYKQRVRVMQTAHFAKYSPQIREKFSSATDGTISQRFKLILAKAPGFLGKESLGLTFNDKDFTLQKSLMIEKYKTTRAAPCPHGTQKADDSVVEMMSEVQAYFEVSHKRFIDSVALLVEFDFVRGLQSEIPNALIDSLDIGAAGAYARCI
ncbi:hypothetical protein BOTBODRAFT_465464 [Botryobasidium botryosum FD-172 SS1]|uniref:GED domain-containing protein n=1 Tax=Botryobasidium botryosum (strain FD-172 SS1) TaxID=930990 RepID=A0A067M5M0_BOTB1|nr:hypothetical protein BOTBODRAFT_465464 [Botryobasidium botryosum FD-172 SS1]